MATVRGWTSVSARQVSLCLGIGAACSLISPQLSAQAANSAQQLTTQPVSEAAPESQPAVAPLPVIEEVYVTGSLLPRGNYMSNAPITTVDSEQFEITSTVNLESLLNTMPQILAGSDRTSTFGFGWATADLRGLGENRTLTLLDGKRIVPSFADGGTVDLNLIPPGIIERVEILTGGASTTYGSDAMAGVINLITKSNVDGFEINAATESTQRGDAQIHNVAGTWGTYFGADRGHVMVHVDLSKRRSLSYQDRGFSKSFNVDSYDAAGNPTGFAPDLWPVNTSGVITSFGNAPDYQFSSQGDLSLFSAAEQGYNRAQDTMLQLPQERGVIFAKTYWQGDSFELRAQAHIASSKLERQQPPAVFGWQSLSGPAQISFEANPFLANSAKFTMLTNPVFQFLNASGNLDFNRNGIPDIANVFLGRVVDELGSTSWDQDYALSQFEIGLSFDLGDMWSVDSYINYGQIEMDWLVDPAIDIPRTRQALLLNPFDPTGQTCMDPSNGCVPLNIYGPNNISQAAQDFVRTTIDMNNSSKLLTFNSVLTGNTADFFEMPGGAGPLGVALGVEYLYREQTLTTDERVAASELAYFGFFPGPIDRELERKSVFAELIVPLLQDLPWASFVEMELAARYTDHETVGGTTSWKVALSWYPIEDVQLRFSFNQAVRAPSINDLYLDFGNQDTLAPPSFFDPCSAMVFNGSADLQARCLATGVPADQIGSPALNVSAQGIAGYYGGNETVTEETGNTFSAGLVWTPYSIEGLSASIDYFDIEIEDYMARLPGNAREHIANCYFPGDASVLVNGFCSSVERDAAGVMTRVNAGLKNIATHSISGFDLSINKSADFLGGVVDATYVASFILDKDYVVDGTNLSASCAGKFNVALGGDACRRPVTDLKHRATLYWSRDLYSLQLTWRHLSSVEDGDDENTYLVESIGSYNSLELGATYEMRNGVTYVGGVRNLLDEDPPILGSNSFEANTYPNLYDVFGRTYYLRASYQF